MKTLATLLLATLTVALVFASEPDSMYIHLTTPDGTDSIVSFALEDIDSIVYYAPTSNEDFTGNAGHFTDSRDANKYEWVKIGGQIWMAENLRSTATQIDNNNDGACGDDDVFTWDNTTYGKLYSWEAAKVACPTGWHLPNDNQWQELINTLGGNDTAGTKMKSTTGWETPNSEATNISGFSGLPGGYYSNKITSQDNGAFWWSSTSYESYSAMFHYLYINSTKLNSTHENRRFGYAVRCIKDE